MKNGFKLTPHDTVIETDICWPWAALLVALALCSLPHTLQGLHFLPPQTSLVKKELSHFSFFFFKEISSKFVCLSYFPF